MATIEISNLHCTVKGASLISLAALDNTLAVDTPGCNFVTSYKQGYWDGKTRFYDKKTKTFPTGLLTEVVSAMRKVGESVDVVDKRNAISVTIPDEISLLHSELGSITLRDYQYDSVVKGIEASRGVVNVATNGGKTEIACGIIQLVLPSIKKGERIVFFTHSKEIFTQSHKRLEERLGMKVGRIGDGKWEEEPVTIVMIPTVQKYTKKPKTLPGNAKMSKLKKELETLHLASLTKKADYKAKYAAKQQEIKDYEEAQWADIKFKVKRTTDFLDSVVAFLGDEVHHASSDTWYKVFMSLENAYFRFGLTGTIDDSDEINIKRLYGCTGRIVTKVSNKYLIDKGYSAKPTIYMLDLGRIGVISGVPYQDARREGIILNDYRNELFVDKIVERANSGKQCLIIVNETEHGDIVLDLLQKAGIDAKFTHGDKTTKQRTDVLDDFRSGELKILIATTILDEGVDVSGINCLFLMSGAKSMRQSLQRIGRGLRKKEDGSGLEVYDALDYHNEFLVDHTMERYNTYKEEQFDIVKL